MRRSSYFTKRGQGCLVAFVVLSIYPLLTAGASWPTKIAIIVVASSLIGVAFTRENRVVAQRQALRQRYRNQRAVALEQNLRSTSVDAIQGFALFLRSFRDSQTYLVRRTRSIWFKFAFSALDAALSTFEEPETLDFVLGRSLDDVLPLIAIGEEEHAGPGRISASGDDWRSRFDELAAKAHFILVVPGETESLLEEIAHIRGEYSEKTLYIKPGNTPNQAGMSRKRWKRIRGVLADRGVESPRYSIGPRVFCHDDDGKLRKVWRIGFTRAKRLRSRMRTVLREWRPDLFARSGGAGASSGDNRGLADTGARSHEEGRRADVTQYARAGSGVELRGVSIVVNRMRIVGPIDLDLSEGEHALIRGPSGSGKSTLLRGVAGLVGISAGTVSLLGESASQIPGNDLSPHRRQVGMVFGSETLWPGWTVAKQIRFCLKYASEGLDAESASRILAAARLEGLEDRLPGDLSAIEKTRLVFARAIAGRPRILLVDEPLHPSDADANRELHELLDGLPRQHGMTIVQVTNRRLGRDFSADREYCMYAGRLYLGPTPSGLLTEGC